MIRPIVAEDRETYLTLCREFYHSDAVLHPVPEQHFERTFDVYMAGSPFVKAFMLEEEGCPAGYGLLAVTFSQEAGGECWWLEELYLRPEYQGRGLGGAFLRYVRENCPASVKRLRLELEPENRDARRLYERMGFRSLGYDQMVLELEEDLP